MKQIVVFDLETTGVNPWQDRIVSLYAESATSALKMRFNPGIPIPPEASAVHGITDDDVKDFPTFAQTFSEDWQRRIFHDAILCGFNSRRFDTIMLHEEFKRAGIEPPYSLETVQEIDVLAVWRSVETHNLSSAVRRWLDREHDSAHDAKEDAVAAWEVLKAIRERYKLSEEDCISRSMSVIRTSCFQQNKDGEWVFAFGMYRGKLAKEQPTYLQWMLSGSFDDEAKRIVRSILASLGQ